MYVYCLRCDAGGGDQDLHRQAARWVVPAGGRRGAGLADRRRCVIPQCLRHPYCSVLLFFVAPLTIVSIPLILRFVSSIIKLTHTLSSFSVSFSHTGLKSCLDGLHLHKHNDTSFHFPILWPWQLTFTLKEQTALNVKKQRDSYSTSEHGFMLGFFSIPRLFTGWYEGERLRDGERGWFAASCAEQITCQATIERNMQRMNRLQGLETNVWGRGAGCFKP